MKIRVLSDLHFEFGRPFDFQYAGEDAIILAGDIHVGAKNVAPILQKFKSLGFPYVLYVPGNHEYYGYEVAEFDKELKTLLVNDPLIFTLTSPNPIILEGVVFIGDTLWTNFGNQFLAEHAAKTNINDFRLIKNWSPQKAKAHYFRAVENIFFHYNNLPEPKVIVSHFLPAQACISPRFRGPNLLNHYFANSLDDWIQDAQNLTWIFGHTHDTMDFKLGDTRLVCNPGGYPQEGNHFDPFFSIKV